MTEPSGLGGWHFDKRVSVGHLVTTAVVGVTAVIWLSDLDKRVEVNRVGIVEVRERLAGAELRQINALTEIKTEIRFGFEGLRTELRDLQRRVDRQQETQRSFGVP